MSDEKSAPHIKIMPNGPYIVSGSTPLTERYPDMSTSGEPLVWDPVGAEVKERPIQEKSEVQSSKSCNCVVVI